jgi:hypothetical protein
MESRSATSSAHLLNWKLIKLELNKINLTSSNVIEIGMTDLLPLDSRDSQSPVR